MIPKLAQLRKVEIVEKLNFMALALSQYDT